jgi:hypothetical protein
MVAAVAVIGSGAFSAALAAPPPTAPPADWAPVPYQRAQLSVPGESWLVESPDQLSCGPPFHGMIFAGIKPVIPKGTGCTLARRVLGTLTAAGPRPLTRPGRGSRRPDPRWLSAPFS